MAKAIEDAIRTNVYFKQSRLSSLYSNFDNLAVLNPEGYEANIEAWSSLLTELVRDNKLLDSMISILKRRLNDYLCIPIYGKPDSIGTVLEELKSRNKLLPLQTFMNSTYPIVEAKSTSIMTILSPFYWIPWSKSIFSTYIKEDNNYFNGERYIFVELLQGLGKESIQYIEDTISAEATESARLFDEKILFELLKEKFELTWNDYLVLLKYLVTDLRKCVIEKTEERIYIKFEDSKKLSEEDIRIIDLKANIANLMKRYSYMESRIYELDNRLSELGRNTLNKNVEDRMKNCLRLKKLWTTSLMRISDAEVQLKMILHKINEATFNKDIYTQLSKGASVLSNLNAKVRLSDIDDLKLDLDREIEATNEIGDALVYDNKVDDAEIERELQKTYETSRHDSASLENEDLLNKLDKLSINKQEIERNDQREKQKELEPA
ncbi:uncharacterized protein PRCAT00004944001 [Priceomyces carsonii]|uniref:uncharacterized protein n=1 Tax=Priceomyces carsonii TaxID=28549 RepID=UPI002ED95635|nr:unnamed protein product [Priceomyces carsonii]